MMTHGQFAEHKPVWFSVVSITDRCVAHPSVKDIQLAVCASYDVTLNDMLSARRTERVITPRHVSMYLARELTLLSLPTIGRATGDRDHTVVRYAHRKIEKLLKSDTKLADRIALIRGQFE